MFWILQYLKLPVHLLQLEGRAQHLKMMKQMMMVLSIVRSLYSYSEM